MQNLKRWIIIVIAVLCVLFILLFSTLTYLQYSVSENIKQGDFASALKKAQILAKISVNPIYKSYYYNLSGNCYIELKNVNNAIKAYEKAEELLSFSNEFERNRLTDLYIVNKNYEKVDSRGEIYKVYILEKNWQKALDALNGIINNTNSGQLIDGKVYADYKYYLARAIVYKNLGDEISSKKDFEIALKLEPSKADEIKYIYKNKDYFKEYYERIEKALK